jgi:hypothetical protein
VERGDPIPEARLRPGAACKAHRDSEVCGFFVGLPPLVLFRGATVMDECFGVNTACREDVGNSLE